MTYKEIVASVSARKEKARNMRFLADFFRALRRAARRQTIIIPRVISVRMITHQSRVIRNPITQDLMKLPAKRVVKIRASPHWSGK